MIETDGHPTQSRQRPENIGIDQGRPHGKINDRQRSIFSFTKWATSFVIHFLPESVIHTRDRP